MKLCEKINIGEDKNRGWKLLHLLALAGLLEETNGTMGSDDTIYGLSTEAKRLFGKDGSGASQTFFYLYNLLFLVIFLYFCSFENHDVRGVCLQRLYCLSTRLCRFIVC
jgi:hypothetical protein